MKYVGRIVVSAAVLASLGGAAFYHYSGTNSTHENSTHKSSIKKQRVVISAPAKADIQAAYKRWQSHYLVTDLSGNTYVNSSDDDSVKSALSESQGYGMYITVLAAQQKLDTQSEAQFDRLFKYYMAHRGNHSQLMAWQQKYSPYGKMIDHDENNATDGDLYIAYSLIQASKLYSDKQNEYSKQAHAILSDILKYNYNDNKDILTLGNWVKSDSDNYNVFRSSDVNPQFFAVFSDFTGDNQWLDLSESMTTKLRTLSTTTKSGLVSDMIDTTNSPVAKKVTSNDDLLYGYNAIRLPLTLTNSQNKNANIVLEHIMSFFNKQGSFKGTYDMNGKVVGDYESPLQANLIHYAASRDGSESDLVLKTKSHINLSPTTFSYYTDTLTLISELQN